MFARKRVLNQFPLFFVFIYMKREIDPDLNNILGKLKEEFTSKAKHGEYDYEVSFGYAHLAGDHLIGINIQVNNLPDIIGSDLLLHVLSRMIDSAGDDIKRQGDNLIFSITEIKITGYNPPPNILKPLGKGDYSNYMNFEELNRAVLKNKDSFIDLKTSNEQIKQRYLKTKKTLEYVINTYEPPAEADKETFRITSYSVTPKIVQSTNDKLLKSNLSVNISFTDKNYYSQPKYYNTIKNEIRELFFDHLPIEFKLPDTILVSPVHK